MLLHYYFTVLLRHDDDVFVVHPFATEKPHTNHIQRRDSDDDYCPSAHAYTPPARLGDFVRANEHWTLVIISGGLSLFCIFVSY